MVRRSAVAEGSFVPVRVPSRHTASLQHTVTGQHGGQPPGAGSRPALLWERLRAGPREHACPIRQANLPERRPAAICLMAGGQWRIPRWGLGTRDPSMPERARAQPRRAYPASAAGRSRPRVAGPGPMVDGRVIGAGGAADARGLSETDLLTLQRDAGNRAVAAAMLDARSADREARATPGGPEDAGYPGRDEARAHVGGPARAVAPISSGTRSSSPTAIVQRAPAAVGQQRKTRAKDRNDIVDLLNGFEDLAGAAVNDGGRRLDSVHFGTDLSPIHHDLLQRIQAALIQAQEKSADSRRAAIAAWPSLDGRMREAIDHARRLGIAGDFLATVANNLAAIGEMQVHAPRRGASQVETPDDYVDLMNGINRLLYVLEQQSVDKTDAVVALNIAETNQKQRADLGSVQFGQHLTPQHREMRREAPGRVHPHPHRFTRVGVRRDGALDVDPGRPAPRPPADVEVPRRQGRPLHGPFHGRHRRDAGQAERHRPHAVRRRRLLGGSRRRGQGDQPRGARPGPPGRGLQGGGQGAQRGRESSRPRASRSPRRTRSRQS